MLKPVNTLLATSVFLTMSIGATSIANAAVLKTSTSKPATSTTKATTTKTTTTKTTTAKTTTKKPVEKTTAVEVVSPTMTTPSVAFAPRLPEPTVTTVSYPKLATMNWNGTDIMAQNLPNVPMPTMQLSDFNMLPTVVIPRDSQGNRLDVSVLDDFITYVSPMARHYPTIFTNNTERYNAVQRVQQLSAWINEFAEQPNASYDVLLRAAKINAIGRNLDLGSDYAVKASNYIARAIKLNDTAEANFLYGAMLAEGGGFIEGGKYLEKAEKMGFAEATQSLAQADLLDDKKDRAIQRLNEFKAKYPNDPYIDEQLRIVNSGQYYIWKIPAKVVR